ncbi:MAG: hypothetical protein LC797_21465, partial [Chloroflexi bacterium]|nr:hypothetical protein [Chloroflexota bacterium]
PLMDSGQGHASPFYGQPLYPYVLAVAHRLTGESLFGPLALPRLGWVIGRWLALGLVIVLGLKLAAAATTPPVGLNGSYWAGATPEGPPERSTDYPWLVGATRIDSRLDLRGDDFAVHFFNDAARFNFGADVQPGRDQLPFSVRWEGWLLAPDTSERRFVVDANGPAAIWLDDAAVSGGDARVSISAGLHALRVEYGRPEARVPRLHLMWQRLAGGPLEAIDGQRPGACLAVLRSTVVPVRPGGGAPADR